MNVLKFKKNIQRNQTIKSKQTSIVYLIKISKNVLFLTSYNAQWEK